MGKRNHTKGRESKFIKNIIKNNFTRLKLSSIKHPSINSTITVRINAERKLETILIP